MNQIIFEQKIIEAVDAYRAMKGFEKDDALDGDEVDKMTEEFRKGANVYQGNT